MKEQLVDRYLKNISIDIAIAILKKYMLNDEEVLIEDLKRCLEGMTNENE